jgi:hypothetical protein
LCFTANILHSFISKLDLATAAPSVCLGTSSIDFGPILIGTPGTLNLNVTNCGNAALRISSVTSTVPMIVTPNSRSSLAIGSTCSLQLTFTPGGHVIRERDADADGQCRHSLADGHFVRQGARNRHCLNVAGCHALEQRDDSAGGFSRHRQRRFFADQYLRDNGAGRDRPTGYRLQVCAIGPERGYFAALRRSLGVASQRSWPLGGTRRVSSTRATPAFLSAVM